jgi:hypothetical protein
LSAEPGSVIRAGTSSAQQLLLQDQPVSPRNPQAIASAGVFDQDLTLSFENFFRL